MKVGTDGVLLGAWANGGSRILDIGTGTGLIALMMAQRFAYATIDAVEIDAEAAAQARENVAATAYADRISIAAHNETSLLLCRTAPDGTLSYSVISLRDFLDGKIPTPCTLCRSEFAGTLAAP